MTAEQPCDRPWCVALAVPTQKKCIVHLARPEAKPLAETPVKRPTKFPPTPWEDD